MKPVQDRQVDPDRLPGHPVVLVWVRRNQAIEGAWLDELGARFDAPVLTVSPGVAPDTESLDTDPADLPAVARIAADRWPDRGVLLLRAGVELPPDAGTRLARMLESGGAERPVLLPGNYHPQTDPLAGMDWPLDPSGLDSLASLCGDRRLLPTDCPAVDSLLIGPAAIARLASGKVRRTSWIADDWYVIDPGRKPGQGDPGGAPAPLGHVRRRLLRLAGEGIDRLPAIGVDDKPVTLHISHNWGGGVARWIGDLIAGDESSHHLVLSAVSDFQAGRFGQWLELYAAGPGRGAIRELALAPPISSTTEAHPGYAEALGEILRRFGVGRILVSSLIGHSLDALSTGLPTAQVLHDYYPAWPLLDRDPLPHTSPGTGPDLAGALDRHGRDFLFAERRPQFWEALTAAWQRRIETHDVRLVAPTRHVAARWRRLLPEAELDIERIPHGFRPWPGPFESVARAEAEVPLRLVILGRLNPGKGLDLLIEALPEITQHARIIAAGCGRQGHRLFGHAGVDVILDYQHDALPELLATLKPDAALFLSTVPETWNYALSEARSLGLVPIATNLGSFTERIAHQVDGILIEPRPAALVGAVAELAGNPGRLAELRAGRPAEPTLADMASGYRHLLPPRPPEPAAWQPAGPGEVRMARIAGQLADRELENSSLKRERVELDAELARRGHWAEMMERQFRERSRWAEKLQDEIRAGEKRLAATREQLATEQQRVRTGEEKLSEARKQLGLAQDRIEQLQSVQALILSSRSWRLTRPLRVLARILRNARDRGLANPLRWPRLVARFFHHLRLRGWRRTLSLMQAPAIEAPAPATVQATASPDPEAELRPVSLPSIDQPEVSVIVPVHNQVHFTAACLASLETTASSLPFEVIVVDDASDDATAGYLEACAGLTVLSNRENLGFIGSCNRGADRARGDYLVFLNNDTTVTAGWLEALVGPLQRDPQAGIVGARLVYPDGRLQEAGGIVFSDGSGWNYGKGNDPDRPEYRFLSEADYVSGACLAIRKEDFFELGGFDSRYAPAYYEDTDLCFRMRAKGGKVIYQPAATVVHHEGATSGTEETGGTKRFQAVNREKFQARWADALANQPDPVPGPEAGAAIRAARHFRSPRRALVIDAVTPAPDHDSGSMRLWALMQILREEGFLVSFMPENLAWTGRYSEDLQQAGIELLCAPGVRDPEEWLAREGDGLDFVLVSRHYVLAPLMKLLRNYCPGARLVFDTVDLHFLREEREAELTGTDAARKAAARTRAAELGLVAAADATLVVSPVEKQLLETQVPDAEIHVVSNIHQVHGPGPGFGARAGLIFVGGFQHPPNLDAADWLVAEILPRVRAAIPDIRLHLIGSRMPDRLRELKAPGLAVHGFVPDIEPFLAGCRVSVAPLRYGAGVKGKVNQAMSHGLPVVATPCAAEGTHASHGHDILIAESAEDFAAEVVRVYRDEALWNRLAENGMANVAANFSVDAARRALAPVLEPVHRPAAAASG